MAPLPTLSRLDTNAGDAIQVDAINKKIKVINSMLPSSGTDSTSTATTTSTTPTVSRYDTSGSTTGLLQSAKNAGALTTEAQAKIQADADAYAAQMRQARIDAINATFAPRIDRAKQEGQALNSRVAALNYNKGIVGSGVDTTSTDAQNKANEDVLRGIENEKALAINEAFGYADALAKSRAETATQNFKLSAEANVQKYKDQLDNATKTLEMFGKAGVTLEDLKSKEPNIYKDLKEVGGLSDFEINQMIQNASQVKYTDTTYNKDAGVLVSYGIDPKTGKPVSYVQKVDIGPGETYQEINGIGYAFKKDANGNYLPPRQLTQKQYAPKANSNYTATNIPVSIKNDLTADITSNKNFTLQQVYDAYPEVSSTYVQSLYNSLKKSSGRSI